MHRILADIMRRDVKDPRVATVTVTGVKVAGDLSSATVYFSMLDPDMDPAPAVAALSGAGGFLRSQLGKAMSIRQVPKLRFEVDHSAAEGARLTALIDEARERDQTVTQKSDKSND